MPSDLDFASDSNELAAIAVSLMDSGSMEKVCEAIIQGAITADTTAARNAHLACGSRVVENRLGDLQRVWRKNPDLSGTAMAHILRAVESGIGAEGSRSTDPEVVWTGPRAETSYLRATRQVVLEIVGAATHEVLVVGYWIAAYFNNGVVVRQVIDLIADKARLGVKVRVVLDHGIRPAGDTNLSHFLALWPENVQTPDIFTWRPQTDDSHLKLHAKVLVVDRSDALVTSANLTPHALDLNMEMGVRIGGPPAASIADHFDLLIANGTLEPFTE